MNGMILFVAGLAMIFLASAVQAFGTNWLGQVCRYPGPCLHPEWLGFGSKYPPAKPGALLSEPLKAAGRGRYATPCSGGEFTEQFQRSQLFC
jgi:hypothetical protein